MVRPGNSRMLDQELKGRALGAIRTVPMHEKRRVK